jgi:UDP-2,3-diacylglucosamine pyrophosphatase LpxH
MALRVNIFINWVRRRLRRPYWSLSAWAKNKVKNAVSVIGRFEEALTLEARDTGVDGVICGHIHFADMHDRLGIHYINTGDWVESCTAICETHEGQFELIKWSAQLQPAPKAPKAPKDGGVLRLRRRKGDPGVDPSSVTQRQASQR